jgi:hypothetical protein
LIYKENILINYYFLIFLLIAQQPAFFELSQFARPFSCNSEDGGTRLAVYRRHKLRQTIGQGSGDKWTTPLVSQPICIKFDRIPGG